MNVHLVQADPGAWQPEAVHAKPADIVAELLRSAHRIRGVLASHFAEFGLSDARFTVLQIVRDSKQITMFRIDLGEKNFILLAPSEMPHTSS